MSAVEEIRVKLETRLHEVEAEIESLRAGLDTLEAQAAAQPPVAAQPTLTEPTVTAQPPIAAQPPVSAQAPAPRRRTRSANGHGAKPSRAELEQLLAQAGGPEAVELARATGADYGVVLARIRELEQAGQPRS